MQSRAANPQMIVLEHSPQQLRLRDGGCVYSIGSDPSGKNLWLEALIPFGVVSGLSVLFGTSVGLALIHGLAIAALPCLGIFAVRFSGGGRLSTYTFDQPTRILTCETPAIFPWRPAQKIQYALDEITAVQTVKEPNDEPPPRYWRSIELRLTQTTLKLYPGHETDDEWHQSMGNLIRDFLDL